MSGVRGSLRSDCPSSSSSTAATSTCAARAAIGQAAGCVGGMRTSSVRRGTVARQPMRTPGQACTHSRHGTKGRGPAHLHGGGSGGDGSGARQGRALRPRAWRHVRGRRRRPAVLQQQHCARPQQQQRRRCSPSAHCLSDVAGGLPHQASPLRLSARASVRGCRLPQEAAWSCCFVPRPTRGPRREAARRTRLEKPGEERPVQLPRARHVRPQRLALKQRSHRLPLRLAARRAAQAQARRARAACKYTRTEAAWLAARLRHQPTHSAQRPATD